MYLMPYNSFDLFDDFRSPFDDFFKSMDNKSIVQVMQTDIKEKDGNYELIVDVPGINKEDIKIELKNGYLNISAVTNKSVEEKDEKENYIRKERYSGNYSRSFYVGEELKTEDVKAKFENGTLTLTFPKVEKEKQQNFIEIQ